MHSGVYIIIMHLRHIHAVFILVCPMLALTAIRLGLSLFPEWRSEKVTKLGFIFFVHFLLWYLSVCDLLFSVISRKIGRKEHLQNDLLCVECDAEP